MRTQENAKGTEVKALYKVEGIPATVLVDRQGRIRTYDVGTATYESLSKGLQALGVSAEGSQLGHPCLRFGAALSAH